jgi:hypothetical protein
MTRAIGKIPARARSPAYDGDGQVRDGAWVAELTGLLDLTGPARRWEPRKLRPRLFSAAGRIVRGSRRLRLLLAARWPWSATSPPPPGGSRHWHPADQPTRPLRPGRSNPRAGETPPTRRDSRAISRGGTNGNANQPQTQGTEPRSRNIEARWCISPKGVASGGDVLSRAGRKSHSRYDEVSAIW